MIELVLAIIGVVGLVDVIACNGRIGTTVAKSLRAPIRALKAKIEAKL